MSKKIYITGLGAVSAIGDNVQEHFDSLVNQRHGLSSLEFLSSFHKDTFPFGEIKKSDEELYTLLNIPVEAPTNRTTLLGMLAVKEALSMSNAGIKDFKTALISSTTVGGMTQTEKYYYEFDKDPSTVKWIDKLDCGDSTRDIANFIGHTGYLTTISTACSSAANAIILGANLIKAGIVQRAICGGTDALSKFTINGFNSLMLLEKEHCRPFDVDRKGLNLGEGAGFIILESEEIYNPKRAKAQAELVGYANTNDAFHQTAASPDGVGAYSAMAQTLELANVNPNQISYINCHGTGTPNNDDSESKGLSRLFGENVPLYSSTKAYTGHTLAAAGGIEAVFSILAIQNGMAWPNLNLKKPIPDFIFTPNTELKTNLNIEYVLSNSFGFGGNNSSLLFKKTND